MELELSKRTRLINEYADKPVPHVIPVEKFFDGNNDPGSIGCNLVNHPGIEVFRRTLTGMVRRGDVDAIYVQIAELDPGEGCWPFTDTVFVVGTIEVDDLKNLLKPLQPDEVGPGENFKVPSVITQQHRNPVLAAWWD
jgi:hypothetical protein